MRLVLLAALTACTTGEGVILVDGPAPTPRAPVAPDTLTAERTTPQPFRDAWQINDPTGSSTIVKSDDGTHAFAVDPDNGTVVRIHLATREVSSVPVGSEPSRITRAGNVLYVTLRSERAVVKLSTDLEVLETTHVGAEPVGILARPDGERVYVAVSQQNQVVELDGASLAELARVHVPGEPRYLAIHPDAMRLYVASGRGAAHLFELDLIGLELDDIPLPATQRFLFETGEVIDLTPRITGDLAVRPGQEPQLAVPVLYSDTITPIPDIADPEDVPSQTEPADPFMPDDDGGYGAGGDGVDRLNPTVVQVELDAQGPGNHHALPPVLVSSPVSDLFAEDGLPSIRSYVSAVTYAPGGMLLATLEASDALVLLDPNSIVFNETDAMFGMPAEEFGFRTVAQASLGAGGGVSGAVIRDSEVFALNAFDHTVTEVNRMAAMSRISGNITMGFNAPTQPLATSQSITFASSPLDVSVQQGRRLFYSARNASMGAGGVSCSTCHFEGRNDGITWTFEGGPRQTPSLAGTVSLTTPVTWTSAVDTVADEADITTRGRMGGQGLAPGQLAAVAAFVDFTRLPDAPDTVDPEAVARGAQVFVDTGCAACHSGTQLTDNDSHAFGGTMINTPKLAGIAGTAPYLMDGSSPTLRDVLLRAAQPGQMGDTSNLDAQQLDDLEAYLKAL